MVPQINARTQQMHEVTETPSLVNENAFRKYTLLSCLAHYCSSQNPIRFASSGTQFAAENRALVNHTFHLKTVSSHVVCGRDCLLDSKCASFNYHTSKRMCELNDASRAHNPSDLLKLRESVYFDYSSDTGLLLVPLKDL